MVETSDGFVKSDVVGKMHIAPGIIRSYGISFLLLPVVAGAGAIWFAMPPARRANRSTEMRSRILKLY